MMSHHSLDKKTTWRVVWCTIYGMFFLGVKNF